ncbi:hypothetical protein [Paenibacillus oleatilyticus]|uniref:hypothetical protein n=1 Tax=Paenibacillus oleatilyticus TaxID=2594886 RepID=UPI001C1FAE7D|nr:hypothetical protein [Paenibacillus oleatilyticus]MBU7320829.1 hypothetical protein [Paenibacillus oleatilyticus]
MELKLGRERETQCPIGTMQKLLFENSGFVPSHFYLMLESNYSAKQTTRSVHCMNDHEIVFDKNISRKYLITRIKVILLSLDAKLPAKVKVVTPDKQYSFKIS